jgi:hypothetical protein
MKKKLKSCKVVKKCSFLWWKWTEEYEEHDWVYINKEKRICKNCGLCEIYFGIESDGGFHYEDWRTGK